MNAKRNHDEQHLTMLNKDTLTWSCLTQLDLCPACHNHAGQVSCVPGPWPKAWPVVRGSQGSQSGRCRWKGPRTLSWKLSPLRHQNWLEAPLRPRGAPHQDRPCHPASPQLPAGGARARLEAPPDRWRTTYSVQSPRRAVDTPSGGSEKTGPISCGP